jgi:uncharacterized RDD family membrane protein YckC
MKYHIARGDDKLGEHNDLDITGGLRRGEFLPTDLCWSAGMPDWEPLSTRFDVQPNEPKEPETDPFSALDGAPGSLSHPRPGDLELANRWQRLMATLLDGITVMPAMLLISKALDSEVFAERLQKLPPETWAATYNQHINDTVAAHPERFYLPVAIFIGLGLINATLLTLRGQTLGKWFTGLRIVKFQTGLNPGFISAVLLRSIAISLLYNAPYVGLGILVFDIACIFRPDKRCLHDLIADTMVIRIARQR